MVVVELMVRATCGSCARVAAQIRPVVAELGADLVIRDVDEQGLAAEFGDRVPVVVVDGEEIAAWEIDDEDLREAIADATAEQSN